MIEQIRRKHPYCFLTIILIIIIILYLIFIALLILNLRFWSDTGIVTFLIIFHIVLVMLLWSIYQSLKQDPGRVPIQWGFSIENKNKKYCLICHVFKPQRTHHCSACNRCVLNMDHHCPWINSCIGFYNRKAFILMLFYTVITTFLNIIAFLASISGIIQGFKEPTPFYIVKIIIVSFGLIFNTIIFITIVLFLKLHLSFIFRNLTTLETLQLKRQNRDPDLYQSQYDIGLYYNWVQVFGRNSLLWGIPIFLQNQGPGGDGVIWPKKQRQQQIKQQSRQSGRRQLRT